MTNFNYSPLITPTYAFNQGYSLMTLPTLTFAYISDDTARALYGSFRPELWFAVEAFLMANPNWATLPTLKLFDWGLLALDISGLAYWAIELWVNW